ncbi:hypothetical protein DL771_011504 [Monosporascus sp. 5C6A]|nr:hypothetical protein DL771_011504 [Monosporascus sp. 5C6A]
MKRYAASWASRRRFAPSAARRASSTSLRSVTDAPPGCAASQSQWRGSKVTSRAITPSFGRPGPRGRLSGSAGCVADGAARSRRASTSSTVPRKSNSTGCAVVLSNTSTCDSGCASTWILTARATSRTGPAARRCVPPKAVHAWIAAASMRNAPAETSTGTHSTRA